MTEITNQAWREAHRLLCKQIELQLKRRNSIDYHYKLLVRYNEGDRSTELYNAIMELR